MLNDWEGVKNTPSPWHYYKWTHMIKTGPNIFRITSLFCLPQLFSVMTSLIFIQNFDNYSFVCIYWTVYCLRIYTTHLKAIDLFLQNIKSLWRHNHSFSPDVSIFSYLMIVQILTEKHFSSNFWTADPLNMVDPSFFSFLKYLHTDNTLVASKYTKNIKWGWMWLSDATWRIFPEIDEKLLASAKILHER